MFLALASISRQISLKTRSVHPSLASSISSLQAVNRASFILFEPSFIVVVGFLQCFCGANSLRFGNMDLL